MLHLTSRSRISVGLLLENSLIFSCEKIVLCPHIPLIIHKDHPHPSFRPPKKQQKIASGTNLFFEAQNKKKRRNKKASLCAFFNLLRPDILRRSLQVTMIGSHRPLRKAGQEKLQGICHPPFFPRGFLSYLQQQPSIATRKSWEKIDLQCKNVDLTGKKKWVRLKEASLNQ